MKTSYACWLVTIMQGWLRIHWRLRYLGFLAIMASWVVFGLPVVGSAQTDMVCSADLEIHAPLMITAAPGQSVIISYAAEVTTSHVSRAIATISIDQPPGLDVSYMPQQQSFQMDAEQGQRTTRIDGQLVAEIPDNARSIDSYVFTTNSVAVSCIGPAFPDGLSDQTTAQAFRITVQPRQERQTEIAQAATATLPPAPTATATEPPPPTATARPTQLAETVVTPTPTPQPLPSPVPTATPAPATPTSEAQPSPTISPTPTNPPTVEPAPSATSTTHAMSTALLAQVGDATPSPTPALSVDVVEERYDTGATEQEDDDWWQIWAGVAGGLLVVAGVIAVWRARPR